MLYYKKNEDILSVQAVCLAEFRNSHSWETVIKSKKAAADPLPKYLLLGWWSSPVQQLLKLKVQGICVVSEGAEEKGRKNQLCSSVMLLP